MSLRGFIRTRILDLRKGSNVCVCVRERDSVGGCWSGGCSCFVHSVLSIKLCRLCAGYCNLCASPRSLLAPYCSSRNTQLPHTYTEQATYLVTLSTGQILSSECLCVIYFVWKQIKKNGNELEMRVEKEGAPRVSCNKAKVNISVLFRCSSSTPQLFARHLKYAACQ